MSFFPKYRAGDIRKYDHLEMSKEAYSLLRDDPVMFRKCCNGVGSKNGSLVNSMFYHFIPNTIGFMNVTGPSDLHDVDFSVPIEFSSEEEAKAHWREANIRFHSNLLYIIGECPEPPDIMAAVEAPWSKKPSVHWQNIKAAVNCFLWTYRRAVADAYLVALSTKSSWKSFMANRKLVARKFETQTKKQLLLSK